MLQAQNPRRLFRFSLEDEKLIHWLDMAICALASVTLVPLCIIFALLVKLTSRGPVFYMATRVGKDGEHFKLYKFRSMYIDADKHGPGITVRGDPRVTPVGRFLRATKLDELPQLINILRGEMSIVGPRPEDPRYVALYTDAQRQLLSVRPGLTSPASLKYSQEEMMLSGENWEKTYIEQILPHKLALDAAYVREYTVRNYLHVIFATVVNLLRLPSGVEVVLQMRNRALFAIDVLLLLLAPVLALGLRLESGASAFLFEPAMLIYIAVSLGVKIFIFYQFSLYSRYWRSASIADMRAIVSAVGVAGLILSSSYILFYHLLATAGLAVYRTVPIIDGVLTFIAVAGLRLLLRVLHEWVKEYHILKGTRRVLVVGAGAAGTLVLHEIRANPELDMIVPLFVDDDPAKIGTRVHGVPVEAAQQNLVKLIEEYAITRVIIAMPSVGHLRQEDLHAQCKAAGVETYSLPGMYELLAGYKAINAIPKVDVAQLLHREVIQADTTEIQQLLTGATVLVTGAGGSIGGELCRQIAQCRPAQLILLGHGENSIFEIGLELSIAFPNLKLQQVIADIRDARRIEKIVQKYKPKVIYHAAAHKHVPLMQNAVEEAVTNNVLGTRNVLAAAEKAGVDYFVLISSDKAINPTSIMGATKRLAELSVQAAARRSGRKYMAVRFGNVLGSRGSVIPVFQRQIAAGGPLTITHPDMTRYFMTIPEAVGLVLQATILGNGAEIFVLDMGKPVRILELAEGLLEMSGINKQRDIEIVFSGLRPGEKLYEELFQSSEEYKRTVQKKIFVATEKVPRADKEIEEAIVQLIELAKQVKSDDVVAGIQQLVPMIQPSSMVN